MAQSHLLQPMCCFPHIPQAAPRTGPGQSLFPTRADVYLEGTTTEFMVSQPPGLRQFKAFSTLQYPENQFNPQDRKTH